MSGTSLDGLDIAQVSFDFSKAEDIEFQLLNCKTYPLPTAIFTQLSSVFNLSAAAIFQLDQELARFYATCVEAFIEEFELNREQITAIASHGQTIYHQPSKGFSTQIGCGTTLNYLTKIPVIDQFRQLDVSAGGQGAPLVPLGDQLLFAKLADGFLNLGGFANISKAQNGISVAYDICPANLPMNRWIQEIGLNYDPDGSHARQGRVRQEVIDQVLELGFFKQSAPKSLGAEWLDSTYLPFFEKLERNDKLRTHLEIIKILCCREFQSLSLKRVFLTGGGAFNTYLIELLRKAFDGEVILPDPELINYKEAVIFAFLGARFLRKESTTLSEVTGAKEALRTGILHDFLGRIG
ncbi:MAG: anhydro-N-acetylmuramic acid kinase [Flavobacteriales bacterium]